MSDIKFSGKTDKFETGATREVKKGKGKFHLIPPGYIRRLAQHYERGGELHGDFNWCAGMPLSIFVNSSHRHLEDLERGDTSEDHVSALYFNAIGLDWTRKEIEAGRLPKSLDDLKFNQNPKQEGSLLMGGLTHEPIHDYYYLADGDIISKGDQYFAFDSWNDVTQFFNTVWHTGFTPYRRKTYTNESGSGTSTK